MCSASPMSTTLPCHQRSFHTQGKLRQIERLETSGWPCSVAANTPSQMRRLSSSVALIEPGAHPGGGVALDDEGAHARRVAVVVRVEGAELAFDERLGQRVERLAWCRTRRTWRRGSLIEAPSSRAKRAPRQRVDAVRRHDQVAGARARRASRRCGRTPARRRPRAPAAAGAAAAPGGRWPRSPRRRWRYASPRWTMVMSRHVCMRGAIRSTVSGSSSRRNSSARSENTTPKPQVASAGFCSTRRTSSRGCRLFHRAAK